MELIISNETRRDDINKLAKTTNNMVDRSVLVAAHVLSTYLILLSGAATARFWYFSDL
jgi:hypothetical protein